MQIQTPILSSLDLCDDQTPYLEFFTLVVEIWVKVYYFGTSFICQFTVIFLSIKKHMQNKTTKSVTYFWFVNLYRTS